MSITMVGGILAFALLVAFGVYVNRLIEEASRMEIDRTDQQIAVPHKESHENQVLSHR